MKFPFSVAEVRARSLNRNQFEGKKLTEIINQEHENKKYLPGVILPDNVTAIPDIGEAVKDATVLIFVMPHQCELHHTARICEMLLADVVQSCPRRSSRWRGR